MLSITRRRASPLAGIVLASVLAMSEAIDPPAARAQSPDATQATSPRVSEGERALLGRSSGATPAPAAPAQAEQPARASEPLDGARALLGREQASSSP